MFQYNKGKTVNYHVPSTRGLSPEMQPTEFAGVTWPCASLSGN